MQFSEDPDLSIQGMGPTLGAAFGQAALAMMAAVTRALSLQLCWSD